MAAARTWLPGLLRDIADAHGEERALAFAARFGGRYLHLPALPRPDHPVAAAFDEALLAWLIERHDPLARVIVPKGPDQDRALLARMVAEMQARGASANDIAEATGLHVRRVHAWRAKLREAGQPDLFARRERA
jgi:hypothetical protein